MHIYVRICIYVFVYVWLGFAKYLVCPLWYPSGTSLVCPFGMSFWYPFCIPLVGMSSVRLLYVLGMPLVRCLYFFGMSSVCLCYVLFGGASHGDLKWWAKGTRACVSERKSVHRVYQLSCGDQMSFSGHQMKTACSYLELLKQRQRLHSKQRLSHNVTEHIRHFRQDKITLVYVNEDRWSIFATCHLPLWVCLKVLCWCYSICSEVDKLQLVWICC